MPSPAAPHIEVSRHGAAAVLRITQPERANALDHGMLRSLVSLLDGPEVAAAHVVLLAGAGERHFSAGLDLGDVPAGELVGHLRAGEELLVAAADAIATCVRPVIGVINGATLGGGLELAMACDWRIARRGARIGMPAARLGVVYGATGLARVVGLIGAARTRRLFLTGRPVEADEAFALGLVDELVEPDELWTAAHRAAADVAACSPVAVAGTRALVRRIAEPPLDAETLAEAERWRTRAFDGPELEEGLRAFRGRRPPRFPLDGPPPA